MTSHLTLPTGDFTCSLSSGCGAVCSATSLPSGLTSASTPASANSTGSASGATPASPAPDAALPGGCVLGMGTAGPDDEHGYLIHSASGKWWWSIEGKEWRKFSGCEWAGIYSCDFALANPPTVPPPDYTPPAPSKPESVESKPAPSPVEGERDIVHVLDEWSRVHGVSIYIRNKPLQEVTGRAVSTIASLRSSLAAARAEVESLKVQVLNLEDAESLFESTRASNAKLKVDLAALKGRVERADALAENVQRCQRAEGPCPVCKAAAADYLAVVPTVEKGAGK